MGKTASTIVVLGLAALAACFEDTGPQTPVVDEEPCTPGEQRSCGCPGDPEGGIQVCVEDGSGFAACECGDTGPGPTTTASTDDTNASGSASSGPGEDTTTASTATGDTTGDTTGVAEGMIIMYATDSMNGGFLAGEPFGRPVVDGMCEAQMPGNVDCTVVHAVIGIDATDSIAMFASNYSPPASAVVVGPSGVVVANSWDELLSADAMLDNSLVMAQVASTNPWTASLDDGSYSPANCANWTNAESDVIGDVGSTTALDLTWKNAPNTDPCNQPRSMLCACWTEG